MIYFTHLNQITAQALLKWKVKMIKQVGTIREFIRESSMKSSQ